MEEVRYKTAQTIIVHIRLAAAAGSVSAGGVGEGRGVLNDPQALELRSWLWSETTHRNHADELFRVLVWW